MIPKGDDLDDFSLSLASSEILYGGGLKFASLETTVGNGTIQLLELAAEKVNFAVGNGHVGGFINELSESLTVSVGNGHSTLKINKIEQENEAFIKIDVANGDVELEAVSIIRERSFLPSFNTLCLAC